MTARAAYPASPIKRARATAAEMEERASFYLDYAAKHGPCTVRQLFYAATVANIPGISKDDGDYDKVQTQVLALRRCGRMPYGAIADATRWMRKPRSYNTIADALADTARFYRKNLWRSLGEHVEIWIEKDALAGVILPVTSEYDAPLMVSRGFSSETFAFEAAENYGALGFPVTVYHLHDFDRSGVAASRDLEGKLKRFAVAKGVSVDFRRLGVTVDQIADMRLPTREPKRLSAADRKWPYDFACELDAIPPDTLRAIVRDAIRQHVPDEFLRIVKTVEESEREILRAFPGVAA